MEMRMGKQPTTNRGWSVKPGTLAEGRPHRQPWWRTRGLDVVESDLGTKGEGPGWAWSCFERENVGCRGREVPINGIAFPLSHLHDVRLWDPCLECRIRSTATKWMTASNDFKDNGNCNRNSVVIRERIVWIHGKWRRNDWLFHWDLEVNSPMQREAEMLGRILPVNWSHGGLNEGWQALPQGFPSWSLAFADLVLCHTCDWRLWGYVWFVYQWRYRYCSDASQCGGYGDGRHMLLQFPLTSLWQL